MDTSSIILVRDSKRICKYLYVIEKRERKCTYLQDWTCKYYLFKYEFLTKQLEWLISSEVLKKMKNCLNFKRKSMVLKQIN